MTDQVDRDRLILILGGLQEGMAESKQRREEIHGMIKDLAGKVEKLSSDSITGQAMAKAYGRRIDDKLHSLDGKFDKLENRVTNLEKRPVCEIDHDQPAIAAPAPMPSRRSLVVAGSASAGVGALSTCLIFSDKAVDFFSKLIRGVFGIH